MNILVQRDGPAAKNVQTKRYQLVTLDVWGNEDDGWDINDATPRKSFVEVPDNATDDETLSLACKEFGYNEDGLCIDEGYMCDNVLCVIVKETYQPMFQMRLVTK